MFRFSGKHFVCFFFFLLLISCNTNQVDSKHFLFDAELTPEHRFPLDNAFLPIRMYIHNDYLILYQSNVSNYHPDIFFAAYSLSDYSYKGSFGEKGRGPGEWLFPVIIRSSNISPYLYLTDDVSAHQTTSIIHKMILDSSIHLRAESSFEIDKGGHFTMNNMVIHNDSLFVYDEFASAPVLKVHNLGQETPVISWKYGAYDGDYNTRAYFQQSQYDENRGIHVANDSCIIFFYTFKDRIDIMDWNLQLKKRLNYQKNRPVIHKDNMMNNILYYSNAFLGQHFLYTYYFGVPYKEYMTKSNATLEVFDLEGTPVCRYTFSPPMPAIFTVDERTFTLYGYRNSDGLEDSISVYRLPGLREYMQNK